MNKLALLILSFLISLDLSAQKNSAEVTRLLFRDIKTTLTAEEKSQLFKKSGFILSRNKKQFAIAGDEASLDYPFDVTVLPADINSDGKEEVFMVFGNSYTSGMTGSNVLLFIKDKTGNYQPNFGFSGTAPTILPTKNAGYPDLLIGGPGFEFPVWRWNGKEYAFYKKITEKNLLKLKTINVEDASKAYVKNIK